LPDGPEIIKPQETKVIGTGLFFEIPSGFEVQVRPRSGLAAKNGITVLNTPGTIDADYRGEIKVILINHSKIEFQIEHQMRIAQIVIAEFQKTNFEIVNDLSSTSRGSGGFGSTGTK
jgi:dUTP pyrophosphatase